jgi:hypothetical protein
MTIIVDRPGGGPKVHVLAIGVGAYRHLPGGVAPRSANPLNLGQLTGPPYSVAAFVDWVNTRMQHPLAALGTVDMLVSPAATDIQSGLVIETPSMANVRAAFRRWHDKCNERVDNERFSSWFGCVGGQGM